MYIDSINGYSWDRRHTLDLDISDNPSKRILTFAEFMIHAKLHYRLELEDSYLYEGDDCWIVTKSVSECIVYQTKVFNGIVERENPIYSNEKDAIAQAARCNTKIEEVNG